jgi:predicted Zn-dependent protease
MILLLFHDKNYLAQLWSIKVAIEECYGPFGLKVQDRGYLHVPFHGPRLNAAKLLKYLGLSTGKAISLWLLEGELYYPEIGGIFGCSTDRSAILSAMGLECHILAKESLHEVGHLLGLDHCTDVCVMNLSCSIEQAVEKSFYLCKGCSTFLRKK